MDIVLVAHNLRSTHNVGSLLRTAEGLGVTRVYLTGYSPYPALKNDERLPHISAKLDKQIHKTALGAESSQPWQHSSDIFQVINELKPAGYVVCALEQSLKSVPLPSFKPPQKVVIVVGREVEGLETEVLDKVDATLEIPMAGKKESYNVTQAAAMALYHCRFFGKNPT